MSQGPNINLKRATLAWCLYDFANSAYTTLIITVAFAVYFRQVVVNAPDNRADQLWGLANFLAMLLVALASPVLGALADYSGMRKRFLILTTLASVGATLTLYRAGPGDVTFAIAAFVVGTAAFEAGYVFYNSFLPEVSTPETVGRVSGWAWGIGYVGGLLCLLACKPWLDQSLDKAAGIAAYQNSFLLVAAWFLIFSLPAFLWLRESTPQGELQGWWPYAVTGFQRVRQSLTHVRSYRETAKFVVASLLFTDGITTVITFAGIYATTTIGFTNQEMILLFLLLNIVALPGALLAGYFADRVGPKRTLVLTLVLWIAVVIAAASSTGKPMFWAMACGAALGTGGTQAVGRSFMSQISPPSRRSEFFGFYVLSGKFASMFGPLLFGSVSHYSGSQRLAVLSILPFFLAGLAFMQWINEQRAMEDAAE